jgi:EAL domain-containing protein (putative c-di-GMP-specific phosphodiesterase class I)
MNSNSTDPSLLPWPTTLERLPSVASTIALAHSLGLRMVAEGVEHEIAYTELARNGCDEAQGHYMCRPVPAAELDHWLALRRTRSPSDHL